MPFPPTGWRLYALLATCFLLVCLIVSAFRFAVLYKRTNELNAVSAVFPRDYYVGNAQDAPLSYVSLGDSTVQGTGCTRLSETLPYLIAERLAATGRHVHVLNLAISGARLADVAAEQEPKVRALAPDVVSLNIGANDATHATSLEGYGQAMQAMLSHLLALPATRIYVATTPDMHDVPALPLPYGALAGNRAVRQNEILQSKIALSRITLIDLYRDGKLPDLALYAPDLFHPGPAGYAQWAALYP